MHLMGMGLMGMGLTGMYLIGMYGRASHRHASHKHVSHRHVSLIDIYRTRIEAFRFSIWGFWENRTSAVSQVWQWPTAPTQIMPYKRVPSAQPASSRPPETN